ncbi:hypothetical protein CspeluHIS016_0306510 [Cutaneotrichosporon spelunceum]|uniref:Uncharacterized protein n=1 Tax=Cutaneotrichosporon spelunceum TaxID=1672016 RepID=A0AAD3YBA7_9TREE|nr:hypothetical protein CspeluHIS016_0306510 [Cutaneotrichosporon spelunceum]
MPRKHRPRTTTLYLPPPEQVEAPQHNLEVLLAAQQLARERGHSFDIESFLSPAQREEYITLLEREIGKSREGSAEGQSGEGSGDGTPNEPAAKRRRTLSAGAAAHWRSRLLARQRTRSATPRIKPEPDGSVPGTPTNHSLRDRDKGKQEVVLPADRPEIQASASYWNHLLVQARESRGPQWDYNTQMLMFDQHTDKYYSQGLPEPDTPPRLPSKKLAEAPNGEPNGEDKGKAPEVAQAVPPSAQPSTPVRFPGPTPAGPGNAEPTSGGFSAPPGPVQSPQNRGPNQNQNQSQLPPHLRMQAAAQANVQAQALALGQSGGFNLNPMLMQGRAAGINPMSLMGGMGGMPMGQMGQMGQMGPQFQGGPQGQGPMVGGWGGEQGFQQNG